MNEPVPPPMVTTRSGIWCRIAALLCFARQDCAGPAVGLICWPTNHMTPRESGHRRYGWLAPHPRSRNHAAHHPPNGRCAPRPRDRGRPSLHHTLVAPTSECEAPAWWRWLVCCRSVGASRAWDVAFRCLHSMLVTDGSGGAGAGTTRIAVVAHRVRDSWSQQGQRRHNRADAAAGGRSAAPVRHDTNGGRRKLSIGAIQRRLAPPYESAWPVLSRLAPTRGAPC